MPDDVAAAFLERLRELQREAGLTDAQLARALGYERSYLTRLMGGTRGSRLSLAFALKAAEVFPDLAVFFPTGITKVNEEYTTGTNAEDEGR